MTPWANESTPDGGDFYWSAETFDTNPHEGWSLPTDDEYVLETSNPEELLLDPEDFDILPGEVQEGETQWTIESPPEDD